MGTPTPRPPLPPAQENRRKTNLTGTIHHEAVTIEVSIDRDSIDIQTPPLTPRTSGLFIMWGASPFVHRQNVRSPVLIDQAWCLIR